MNEPLASSRRYQITSLNNGDIISSCNNFKMNEDREDQGEDENRSRRFVKADDPALAEDDDKLLRSGLSHVLLKEVQFLQGSSINDITALGGVGSIKDFITTELETC